MKPAAKDAAPVTDQAATPPPKKERKSPGRKPHAPTKSSKKKVRMIASLGFTQEEISLLLEIGETTLVKHYAHELRVGGLEADVAVLKNLFRIASKGKDADAKTAGIFWAKVRRRWHEVQRVIHGYDPDTIKTFVKSVTMMLRRELPDQCPGCRTKLGLGPKVAAHLVRLSQEMATKLPQSEVVAMPVPPLASDGLQVE